MSDPYETLGVSPSASDEEVKSAYRTLAKKYHPDHYANSPLADVAAEKMKEINEAYDTIVKERKERQAGNSGPFAGSAGYGHGYSGYAPPSEYADVRNLIYSGRNADAEQILDGVPADSRNAEWHFLKGTVLYRRGWLEDAYQNLSRACQIEPGNAEYRTALNQISQQRGGMYGGYSPYGNSSYDRWSGCDLCTTLCAANACCNCLGGGRMC